MGHPKEFLRKGFVWSPLFFRKANMGTYVTRRKGEGGEPAGRPATVHRCDTQVYTHAHIAVTHRRPESMEQREDTTDRKVVVLGNSGGAE